MFTGINKEKLLIALGGNAIKKPKQIGSINDMISNVSIASQNILKLHDKYKIAITHGNGPQIGSLYLQNQISSEHTPEMPLHVCDSMTQGQIGYLLQQSINNEISNQNISNIKGCITCVTQVSIDKNDKAFNNPTKPIGKFYTKDEADILTQKYGYYLMNDSNRGYRIAVPSPKPINIIESNAIYDLFNLGYIVIACGGGGIPVKMDDNNNLSGIDAVIDKDLTAVKMAMDLNCDILLIATDIDGVYLNYNDEIKRTKLNNITTTEALQYMESNEFGKGSMQPKIEAAINFVEQTGNKCIIGSLETIQDCIEGNNGTTIISDKKKRNII